MSPRAAARRSRAPPQPRPLQRPRLPTRPPILAPAPLALEPDSADALAAENAANVAFTGLLLGLSGSPNTSRPGIAASIGSVGDAYDNALMESTIGLYKTEVIKPERPWKTPSQVELATPNGSTRTTTADTERSATSHRFSLG